MAVGANDSSHSSSENDEYLDFEYLDMHIVECLNVGSPPGSYILLYAANANSLG